MNPAAFFVPSIDTSPAIRPESTRRISSSQGDLLNVGSSCEREGGFLQLLQQLTAEKSVQPDDDAGGQTLEFLQLIAALQSLSLQEEDHHENLAALQSLSLQEEDHENLAHSLNFEKSRNVDAQEQADYVFRNSLESHDLLALMQSWTLQDVSKVLEVLRGSFGEVQTKAGSENMNLLQNLAALISSHRAQSETVFQEQNSFAAKAGNYGAWGAVSSEGGDYQEKLLNIVQKADSRQETAQKIVQLLQTMRGNTSGTEQPVNLEASLNRALGGHEKDSGARPFQGPLSGMPNLAMMDGQHAATQQQEGLRMSGIQDPLLQQFLEKNELQGSHAGQKGTDWHRSNQSPGDKAFRISLELEGIPSASQDRAGKAAPLPQPGRASGQTMINGAHIVQQVTARFKSELQKGETRITVNMHPPELGSVKLKLISRSSGMQAQILVQNLMVQNIIEKNLPVLREALSQHGLDGEKIEVCLNSDERDGDLRQFQEKRQPAASGKGKTKGSEESDIVAQEDYQSGSDRSSGINLRV